MKRCDDENDDYPIDLFDESHLWMKYMISQNAWFKFYYAMKGGKKPNVDISSGSYHSSSKTSRQHTNVNGTPSQADNISIQ